MKTARIITFGSLLVLGVLVLGACQSAPTPETVTIIETVEVEVSPEELESLP
ncbi:MAG: hypothetical protein QGD88_11555 [Anaerolineae bacterium]|nr:hypothetical protein [Anaerolineae bacterium]MDK1082097.1 hypothetical protein [Anaerolineae bacterium]